MSERRIAAQWRALRGAQRVALIPYLTAGYPDRATSLEALTMAADAGADFLEVGIPFSDPLADGPAIQRASDLALRQGMTTAGALELIAEARLEIPVVVFSYLNPLLAYDLPRFGRDARAAGVAGVLITDLPAGEDPRAEAALRSAGLDLIRLIAPTTSPGRMGAALRDAEGFVYLISRLGVTGPKTVITTALEQTVERLRGLTDLPVAVGFGMAAPDQARTVARFADGVVVGSALVECVGRSVAAGRALLEELRAALSGAPGAGR